MASLNGFGAAASTHAPKVSKLRTSSVHPAGIFPRNGPDSSARSWSRQPNGVTFAAQPKLPKQPLPSLEDSCQRYLDAVRPLQSAQEHEDTKLAVNNFLLGEGLILQAQLEEYAQNQDNYFEHFCYEAFLGDNSSVVLNSNAFCSFQDDPDPSRRDQIARAAALARSALTFAKSIREDRLEPDTVRGVPQCMNQYWWLFGVARVPETDGGRIRMDVDAKHIIVLCRGNIYSLQGLIGDSDEVVSEEQLSAALRAIWDDAHGAGVEEASQQAVGLLTTGDQKIWAHFRKELVHGGSENGRNLSTIDSSLFALCMDDSSPESDADVCRNMICGTNLRKDGVQTGTCINRWYDKLAIIVCKNGAAGMNFEHTCSDGSVDIKMACDIYEGSIVLSKDPTTPEPTNGSTNGEAPAHTATWPFRKLRWEISNDIKDGLVVAEKLLTDRMEQHQLQALKFTHYGSTFIKSVGISPDAFFQMVLQAAYFRTYRQIKSGFEPVVTRQFLHGRTDVVRTTTQAAIDFAHLYSDASASTADKLDAMHKATKAHVALSRICAKGCSHHRHLYVLQQLWKRRRAALEANGLADLAKSNGHAPEPTIFSDSGYSKLGTTILMGSNVDNPCLAYAGFGPAADEGFTVCYYIRADHMAMSVTSRNGQAEHFTQAIKQTFDELHGLLLSDEKEVD